MFSPPSILNSTKFDNNLTVYGNTIYKQGKSNSALYFDGSTYAEIQNTANFNPNEITIELWVKPE